MKTRTLITLAGLAMACVAIFAAPISPLIGTLFFTVVPDPSTMGGMPTNDFATNFVVEIKGSPDCTIPTNLWPTVAWAPMTQLTNQGPMGTEWTQAVQIVSNPTFFIARATNLNGGIGPFFTNTVTWVSGAPPGRLRAAH